MESDKQSILTTTTEEEFDDTDEITKEDCVHRLDNEYSRNVDDVFSAEREEEKPVFNRRSQSVPEVKASVREQHLDLNTPVASESSLRVFYPDKFEVKADSSIFFDQARRESLHKQRAGSQMQARSKLCQTDWSWEEDVKLLALHSENSSFFSNLLSEMNGAELRASPTKDFERESDKCPFRAKQFRTGSEAGDDDSLLIGWENEMDKQMENSNEDWLTSFVKTLPSVGPPQILQYKKESAFPYVTCPPSQKEQTATAYETLDEELKSYIFQLDRAALRTFVTQDCTAICQFCEKEASVDPYCCKAYCNHLEILQKSELNECLTGKFYLDLKSQMFRGSQMRRKGDSATVERSHLRSAKKKQFADQTFGSQHSLKQSKSSRERQTGSLTKDKTGSRIKDKTHSRTEDKTGSQRKDKDLSTEKVTKDQNSSRMARNFTPSMVKDAILRSQPLASNRNLVGPNASLYQQGGRQLKTISYQLSSKKCLQDGWTLSFSPSLARSELNEDYNDLIQISRLIGSNSLFVRTYNNGNIFAVIFPDGSGTIFHPDGRVAISVVLVGEGLYTYIVQSDSEESKILAIFQPDGHAFVYFPDGRLRISLSPTGGLEIGRRGAKKRKWLWHDMYDQQQRAPLQPITIGIMPECGIRIMSQANITVTYNNDCRNIRLHVGTKLKLSSQFRHPVPKDLYDQDEQFRKETKLNVSTLINQILTVLEFPKSPKLDNIPLPLHLLNSNQQKKYPRSQLIA